MCLIRKPFFPCVLLLGLLLSATGAPAQEVTAVLSADLGPYQEAFQGFQEAFGKAVSRLVLGTNAATVERGTRVVVAFGGKAAMQAYPDNAVLIYCLAPGTRIDPGTRRQAVVKVEMLPRAEVLVKNLRALQPGLKRLAVLWESDAMGDHVREVERSAASFDIEVVAERVAGPDELPDRLRALLQERADALWLPPDPLLITPRSFTLLKSFCWANRLPFYAPTAGLVEKGAVASLAVSFQKIGQTAGRVARLALSGATPEPVVYPDQVELTVNLTAAARSGLTIPQEVLSRAERVIP